MLERIENGARARNHRRRHAGQPRHLNTVAAIGPARYDLVKKHDAVLPFARGDMRVGHTRQRVRQIKTSDVDAWRRIPWADSLTAAAAAAKKEDRPMFVFSHEGNIDTGRC